MRTQKRRDSLESADSLESNPAKFSDDENNGKQGGAAALGNISSSYDPIFGGSQMGPMGGSGPRMFGEGPPMVFPGSGPSLVMNQRYNPFEVV